MWGLGPEKLTEINSLKHWKMPLVQDFVQLGWAIYQMPTLVKKFTSRSFPGVFAFAGVFSEVNCTPRVSVSSGHPGYSS